MTPVAPPSVPSFTALDLIAMGSVFVLVMSVCAAAGVLVLSAKAKRRRLLRERVGAESASELGAGREGRVVHLFRGSEEVEAILPGEKRGPWIKRKLASLEVTLRAAGVSMTPATAVLSAAAAAVAIFAGAFVFTGHALGAGVGAAVSVYGLWTLVKIRASKTAAKFDDQFVEALGLCARSLRAGHTVTSGLALAAEETAEPVKSVLSEIVQQQELGVGLEEALRRVAAEHPSPDLRLFAASVSVQVRAGGNLAETIGRLAAVIRERLRLARRVRVLIAQTQMSKQVLLALPVLVFGLLNLINPEYVRPMYATSAGQMLLIIGVVGLAFGSWLMNKMSVLKY